MRAGWEGLHAALVDSVTTWEMAQLFEHARSTSPELQPFATVTGLLELLGTESSSLEHKNIIYRALVFAVQARVSWAPLATILLWCGLWPGLDAVYRRQRRYFFHEPDELASLISVVFTSLVAELDLQAVQRVAATLVRSTGREVTRVRQRQLAIAARETSPRVEPRRHWGSGGRPEGPTEPSELLEQLPDVSAGPTSVLGIPTGLSPDAQTAALHRWLHQAVGEDAALFISVAVLEESPEVVAHRLGLSHVALRKRIQRIRTRLRKSLSKLTTENGMSPVRDPHKSTGSLRR